METKLPSDFIQRLSENEKLYRKPGLGAYSQQLASLIGLHAFWVLVVLSFGMTWFFLRSGLHLRLNSWLFGWLFK